MSEYLPTIGLEIHVELKTASKMFCGCASALGGSASGGNESIYNQKPNTNVCPVCMGHPGTLPVINEEAVRKVLLVGKALNGKLADYSQFDRKNYFYPDIPKGYQISQYKFPLVSGGELGNVKITRIHLEEDTGKLTHETGNLSYVESKSNVKEKGESFSYIDFNRAGLPLMELVTEPVIHSAEDARKFAEELRLILRYLDVSDADMEKGQMRIEANISVSKSLMRGGGDGDMHSSIKGSEGNDSKMQIAISSLGTKVEVKNLNSFRAVERAINFEIERQKEILEGGGKITHETRGWDESKQITFSQRAKEESHDYRYFPEPDLPSLRVSNMLFSTKGNKGNGSKKHITDSSLIPELPQQKRLRFKKEFNLKDDTIEVLVNDKKLIEYFEKVASIVTDIKDIQLTANYILTDMHGDLSVDPKDFACLMKTISSGDINSRAGKDVLKIMIEIKEAPMSIIERLGLKQVSDESAVEKICDEIINENQSVVDDYKTGKEPALQFLVGQGMKKTKGSVNPDILKTILKQKCKN